MAEWIGVVGWLGSGEAGGRDTKGCSGWSGVVGCLDRMPGGGGCGEIATAGKERHVYFCFSALP